MRSSLPRQLSIAFALAPLALLGLAGCGSTGGATAGGDAGSQATTSNGSSRASGGSSHHTEQHSGSASSHPSGHSSHSRPSGSSGTTTTTSTSGGSSGGSSSSGPAVGASVLQFHNHVNRDGFFVDGAITKAAAATFALDASFAGTFSGNVYASPLYVEKGVGGKGTFYVATDGGSVYALDEATGSVTWTKSIGTAPTQSGAGCGNIGMLGVIGTPAIDLATRLIVFDAATADGSGSIKTHSVYALSLDTGAIKWTVDVSTLTSAGGVAFNPQAQNERGAVLIVNGTAYVPYGGHYGDCGDYHGWVVGVPLSGTGAKAWATTAQGAGIWGPGGPASDGESIFVTTGNALSRSTSWAESEGIFRLDPGPTFTQSPTDSFAPYNWSSLDQGDVDLSGSGPLVIDAPALTPSKLVMAQGKDGYLYLVDRTDLGGIATSSKLANVGALKVQSGEITNASAWATVGSTTYVVVRPNGQNGGIGCPAGSGDMVAVKLDPAASQKMTVAWCAQSGGVGSPSITTSDGTNDALLWAFAADPGNAAQLLAWDLATGAPVFTGGGSANRAAGVRRFTTPIAVHGRMFVAGDGQLYAWKAN